MIGEKSYTHLIWDWNGTLLDDAWLCVDVMNSMLKERNLPEMTLATYQDIFGFPVRNYYMKLGFDFVSEPFDTVGLEFINRYQARRHESGLHTEAREVLDYLAVRGYSQNILSAREQQVLLEETRQTGLTKFFEHVRGLDDHYAHGKTDAGIKLLSDMGISTENILFIGDTSHDAEVASELGIDCILIPNGHQSRSRLEETGNRIAESLIYLKQLL